MLIQAKPKMLIDALEFYLEDCSARRQSNRTVSGKRSNINLFIIWCHTIQIKEVKKINREVLELYRNFLNSYKQPIDGKPLNISTIRNRLTAVKVFLRRLFLRDIIKKDPGLRFELPQIPRKLPKGFLTVEDIEKTLSLTLLYGLKGLRDRTVLETYYATGLRRMELATLKIDDVDFKNMIVTVNEGKGSHERRVPIAKRACEWIKIYLESVRPFLANVESGLTLFLANDGLAFRPQQLTGLASKYVKKAGIKKPGACNLFRHSTATLMHENGADIRHIQEMLGHADISTTQVYTHVTINKLREVYQGTHPAALTESKIRTSLNDRGEHGDTN